MFIKDLQGGAVHEYGTNPHDALKVTPDGKMLIYENLQNGDTSTAPDGYRFCDENGVLPKDDPVLQEYGADCYFNIGGFNNGPKLHTMSERIRFLIFCSGLTQKKCAEILGVTEQTVSHWVNKEVPPRRNINKLAKMFNVSKEWILTGRG